ncbi:TetR/AcrR family transcriptional regulator [Nocardiopsis sp. NRRL B-16309]|uniref:TetR/AcrR family transcriptional regulator n=1 Tax=Nocardiopsis sp. NRRL B-16309 TaxID=1519494 RepID=UPI0006B02D4B|nr:TetR/AcrR family transcriptional regulator [Nocardiopsis sp. NRRL B-16309]
MNVPDQAGGTTRSARKRREILTAAQGVFLDRGYLGTNMDEIAALSGASKQTVYKHFGSKEALFVEIVQTMTAEAGDAVHQRVAEPESAEDLAPFLREYALRQLTVVLTPELMRLRRLVIGEVSRFPDLARALYDGGPRRAMAAMAALFTRLSDRGLLKVADPDTAAAHFNWLVMSAPVNDTMLLGDDAIPDEAELRRHADEGVRVFLAAYGRGGH